MQLFDLRRAIGVLCSPKVLVKYALPNADQAISVVEVVLVLLLLLSSREKSFAECRPGHLRSDARVCSQDNGPSIFLAPFQATRDGEGY